MDSMETTPTTSQPTEPTPQSTTAPPPSSTPPATEIPNSSSPNPNPNPTQNTNPNPQSPISLQQKQQQQQPLTLQHSQTRPQGPQINRARPQPPFSQFSPHIPSLPSQSSLTSLSPSLSSPNSPSVSTSPMQRGGLAIGVPAHQARPPPTSFSTFGPSSFSQQYGGLARNSVNMPESVTNSNTSQVKQSVQGIQTIGTMGSLGSGSQMRPSGVPPHHQQRAVQPALRSQSPSSNQSLATQKFQNHGLLRVSSMGSPSSPSPGTPQGSQPHTQPWMSANPQGKQMHPPSLASPSYRSQLKPQSLQQRSHLPQQHLPLSSGLHQQMPSAQQQQQQSQSQEHYGQQYPPQRVPQSMQHQQLAMRNLMSGNQKSPTLGTTTVQSSSSNTLARVDVGESSNHILSKKSIHDLVAQIDPSESLDPDVEDILVEIAEDFVDSVTTIACSLAKHRKSTTLEAKDILLHLERNWNMTLPGYGGDEIKSYKKPFTNDVHKERLAAIKKSVVGTEAVNMKNSAGQVAGSTKGHATKAPTTGSPKAREMS